MCNYQTLFHDDDTGYVVLCKKCNKIQIDYGNLMLTVSDEGFQSFRWWLHKIREEQPAGIKQNLRCIILPTPCEGIKLLVSMRELTEFENMLETADSELQSLNLLRLFETDSSFDL